MYIPLKDPKDMVDVASEMMLCDEPHDLIPNLTGTWFS
jgi:hypothetical protein